MKLALALLLVSGLAHAKHEHLATIRSRGYDLELFTELPDPEREDPKVRVELNAIEARVERLTKSMGAFVAAWEHDADDFVRRDPRPWFERAFSREGRALGEHVVRAKPLLGQMLTLFDALDDVSRRVDRRGPYAPAILALKARTANVADVLYDGVDGVHERLDPMPHTHCVPATRVSGADPNLSEATLLAEQRSDYSEVDRYLSPGLLYRWDPDHALDEIFTRDAVPWSPTLVATR